MALLVLCKESLAKNHMFMDYMMIHAFLICSRLTSHHKSHVILDAGEDQFQNPNYYLSPSTAKDMVRQVWHHAAKQSKFPPKENVRKRMAQRAMQALQEITVRRGLGDVYPSPQQVVDTVVKSSAFQKGRDWVNQLVPLGFLLYGCVECDRDMIRKFQPTCDLLIQMTRPGVYPLQSKRWLKLVDDGIPLEPGQTFADSHYAHWHCPCCCAQWTHATQAEYRLLVLGPNPDNAKAGDQMFCAYIDTLMDAEEKGQADAEQARPEKQINLLKGMTLLQQIGNRTVTKDLVLTAIEQLNATCENKLCSVANVVQLLSANHQLSKCYQRKQLYCEDECLSIGPARSDFLALAVDRDSVPRLTKDHLQKCIDLCASFYDLDEYDVRCTPSERKTFEDMRQRVTKMDLASSL